MRAFLRILSIVAIPVGIASFYSVYADEPGLDGVAQRTACAGQKGQCRLRLAKLARMPWKRAFVYGTGPSEGPAPPAKSSARQSRAALDANHSGSGKVQVDCTRTFVLVGDYHCARAAEVQY